MSDADLRLNSLERFKKLSPDLVLEEHGSCEVPAGCGGVVLRWVKRGQERSRVYLNLVTRGQNQAWLDGAPLERGSVWLGAGLHVLAVQVDAVAPGSAGLIQGSLSVVSGAVGVEPVFTAADGSWRATTVPPGEAWTALEFDGAAWTPLEARPLPPPNDDQRYSRERLDREGAVPLGLPAETLGPVWLRTTFELRRGGR